MNHDSQQLTWNIRSFGGSSGTPLLWLHGFMGAGEDWRELINSHLPDHPHLLIDLPGHGSFHIGSPLNFTTLQSDLLHQLTTLGIHSFIPVGYSMGGRIAFHLQKTAPEQIPALIILSGAPGLKSDFERKHRRMADEQLMDHLDHVGLMRFLDEWYAAGLFGEIRSKTALFEILQKARSANDPNQLRLSLDLLGNGALPGLWDNLENIHVPTLLLTGELDKKYRELNLEISRKIPGSSHEVIDDAGHAFHLEKPLETACVIRHFLSNRIEGE